MSKRKGEKNERRARDVLQDAGYRVEKCKNSRFGNNDYFNLYDLMAVKPGEKVKYVQVKTNGTGGVKKSYKQESLELLPQEHAQAEMWIWYDYKGWRIMKLMDGQWVEVCDERDKNPIDDRYEGVKVSESR